MMNYVEVAGMCPMCGGPTWWHFDSSEIAIHQWKECESCGAKIDESIGVITTTSNAIQPVWRYVMSYYDKEQK
jgi:hypothetical protein